MCVNNMSFPTTISIGWSKKPALKSLKTISSVPYFATNVSAAPEACGRECFDGLTFVTNNFALDREGGTMLIRETIKVFSCLHIDDTTPKIVSDTVNS